MRIGNHQPITSNNSRQPLRPHQQPSKEARPPFDDRALAHFF